MSGNKKNNGLNKDDESTTINNDNNNNNNNNNKTSNSSQALNIKIVRIEPFKLNSEILLNLRQLFVSTKLSVL